MRAWPRIGYENKRNVGYQLGVAGLQLVAEPALDGGGQLVGAHPVEGGGAVARDPVSQGAVVIADATAFVVDGGEPGNADRR